MDFRFTGGERGIRTLEALSRLHGFQPCSFSHSDTSPGSQAHARSLARHLQDGGERGIRTLDTLSRIAVFETARFSHSRISPRGRLRDLWPVFQAVVERAAARSEEFLEHVRALFREHSGDDFRSMIEAKILRNHR